MARDAYQAWSEQLTSAITRARVVKADAEGRSMEFLVDFKVNIPDGTPESEVRDRESAEATAASKLVEQGHQHSRKC